MGREGPSRRARVDLLRRPRRPPSDLSHTLKVEITTLGCRGKNMLVIIVDDSVGCEGVAASLSVWRRQPPRS